ncbi:flavin reductase family protein [Desulfoferrobacter suflitae]|uniref:flavin reductase family protein n=1 Tax=Desulfoferrobacter suflitae TaxID=2865782 RepID=UPI0021642BE0|nr:flavin reductase family protein [Desulfoferrobacter suflitae]MCK8600436.1 flavin reductase family protein [Desulfoferrobacter suflitae]
MKKITMGPKTLLFPMPACLIGARVDGKSNFMTAAWCGIANSNPPMLTVGIQHHRHTYKGIRQNDTFSVNIPSENLVKETDYCGIVSGAQDDKTETCRFTVFYGKLKTAPLIVECPVNLECQMLHMLNLGSHALLVGLIEETHVSVECMQDGEPDARKVRPIIYGGGAQKTYFSLGEPLAPAFKIGKALKNRE